MLLVVYQIIFQMLVEMQMVVRERVTEVLVVDLVAQVSSSLPTRLYKLCYNT